MSSSTFSPDTASPFTRHRLGAPTIFLPALTANLSASARARLSARLRISAAFPFRARKILNATGFILGALLTLSIAAPSAVIESPQPAPARR